MIMKNFIWILALLVSASALSQKMSQRELTPVRGHYQQLQKFDPSPKGISEVDKLKFPYDVAVAERRLSLKPVYLTKVKMEDFKIPDPPANSSEQTRAEINYLLGLQAQRTSLDEQTGLFMAGVYYNARTTPSDSSYSRYRNNLFFIGRSVGTWFTPENLPLTADFMARVWQDASYFIWSMKYKYLRIRPVVIDSTVHNLEDTNWAAYPSGHAANSYINAYLYSELGPEFTDIFIKDAYDMAHSREIIGVHYPSDSEASRVFARQFVNKLLENEKFVADFKNVKAEWAAKSKESFIKPLSVKGKEKNNAACAKTCN
jgi:acid phosphatase (class A)